MRVYSFYIFREHCTGWIGFSKPCIYLPFILLLAFTFKIDKFVSGTHYIFTNQARTCGVYISESLNICGADPLLLEYFKDDWNRMIIQYSSFKVWRLLFLHIKRRQRILQQKGWRSDGACFVYWWTSR